MKQLFTVLVLIFALIFTTAVDSQAKMKSDSYYDLLKPDSDDHPWGGEDQLDPDKSTYSPGTQINIKTGLYLIDLFYSFMLDFTSTSTNSTLIKGSTDRQIIVQDLDESETFTTETETNSKGK